MLSDEFYQELIARPVPNYAVFSIQLPIHFTSPSTFDENNGSAKSMTFGCKRPDDLKAPWKQRFTASA